MKTQYINLTDIPFPDTNNLERQVLADAVDNSFTIGEVSRMINGEMFLDSELGNAWKTLNEMYTAGEQIDLSTFLSRCGQAVFNKVFPYTGKGVTDSACIAHGAALYHTAARRRTYFKAIALAQKATTPGLTADDMEAAIDAMREELRSTIATETELKLSEVLNQVADTYQERQERAKAGDACLCPTGVPRLDKHTNGGWEEGQLVIVAARPSVGKTALMLQMAEAAGRAGFPACIFSMEMTNEQLGRRYLMDNKGNLTSREVMTGLTRDEDMFWNRFEQAVTRFDNLPVYVNDTTRSLEELVARISLNARRGKCRVAFLDYLGFIRDEDNSNAKLSQQIANITGTLKQTAKQLRIPIVLLCQLNRESAKGNRPPELYDLRDSGAIEQDADIVLMLEHAVDNMGNFIVEEPTAEERIEIMNAQLAGETMLPTRSPNVNMWVRKNRVGRKNFAIELRPSLYYTHFEDIGTKIETNEQEQH